MISASLIDPRRHHPTEAGTYISGNLTWTVERREPVSTFGDIDRYRVRHD